MEIHPVAMAWVGLHAVDYARELKEDRTSRELPAPPSRDEEAFEASRPLGHTDAFRRALESSLQSLAQLDQSMEDAKRRAA